jgi:hypothetical protein
MNHDNERRPERGQSDPSSRKRRRSRLPVHASLRLDDTLPANSNHLLAATSPDIREASRLRLIATILARLAQTGMAR